MDIRSAVLVVIDVQNGFLNAETRHVLPTLKDLVRRWLEADGVVVFTRYHNFPGSPFERFLHWYKLRDAPQTDLASEFDEFVPRAAGVLDKTGYTALVPELEKLIAEGGYTDVVLCGFDTETCVLKSAADVFEHGLAPWLVHDACASNGGEQTHELGLRLARRFIGPDQIVSTMDLADYFRR